MKAVSLKRMRSLVMADLARRRWARATKEQRAEQARKMLAGRQTKRLPKRRVVLKVVEDGNE